MTPRPLTLEQLREIARNAPMLVTTVQVVAVVDLLLAAEAYWRERAERLAQRLLTLTDAAERDLKLNRDEDHGGFWSPTTETAITEARAALAEEPKP